MPHYKNFASSEIFERMTKQVAGRAGLLERQAGDGVDDHGVPLAGGKVADLAGDLDDLGGVREPKWRTVTALRVRISTRPWPRSRVRSATGTLCQARAAQRSSRVGWLALTTSR